MGQVENTFWLRKDSKNIPVKDNVISNTYK